MDAIKRPIETFAKTGYAARAAVYALMGTFALLVMLGFHGTLTDPQGSLRALLARPLGSVFLFVLALGLFAYAIWRVFQSYFDYDRKGSDPKGLALRAGYLFGGLNHALLGFYAINLIFHLARSSNQDGQKQTAHWLLTQPFGQILAGLVALGIIGFGVGQVWIAVSRSFCKGLQLPPDKKRWLLRVCQFGLISRGVVFSIVGWLFLQAARHVNSSEAAGVKGAWGFLEELQYGRVLVTVISLGLVAFAIYGLTEALYRQSADGHVRAMSGAR